MTLTKTKPEASTLTVYRLLQQETGSLILETIDRQEMLTQQRSWLKMCRGHFKPLTLETREYRPVA